MAFNPINFLNAPRGTHPLEGLSRALAEGYQLGQMPFQMWDEQKKRQLENAMSSLLVQQEPQRFQMDQETGAINNEGNALKNSLLKQFGIPQAEADLALKQAQTEDIKSPFHQLSMLSGDPKEALGLELLKVINPTAYNKASDQMELNNAAKLQDINYKKMLEQTASKRFSSGIGKIMQEYQDIENGFAPGSNGQIPIDSKQQEKLKAQYGAKISKDIAEADAKNRLNFAENIETTINSINPNALAKYSGIAGALQKKIEQGKSLTDKETEDYAQYQESLTALKALQEQLTQFWGTSITPTAQKELSEVVNPFTWSNNGPIAIRKFQKLVDIFRKERNTYRTAVGEVVKDSSKKGTSEFKDNFETTTVYRKGKPYQIPNSKVKAALAAGGSLNG